ISEAEGDIYATIYDGSDGVVASEFEVNTHTADHQFHPVVAMNADGNFAVAWQSWHQAGAINLAGVARYYERVIDGATVSWVGQSGEDVVQTDYVTNVDPSIAINSDSTFVVVWAYGATDSDSFWNEIEARRYTVTGGDPSTVTAHSVIVV